MIVSDIIELDVHGVFDRGLPNKERIAIYVKSPLNIGQYGLMIGIKASGGTAIPIRDNLFWFGDGFLNAGDWIFIYTGAGTPRASNVPGSNAKLYISHWGKPTTIFQAPELVPILFRVDAVFIPQEKSLLPAS